MCLALRMVALPPSGSMRVKGKQRSMLNKRGMFPQKGSIQQLVNRYPFILMNYLRERRDQGF